MRHVAHRVDASTETHRQIAAHLARFWPARHQRPADFDRRRQAQLLAADALPHGITWHAVTRVRLRPVVIPPPHTPLRVELLQAADPDAAEPRLKTALDDVIVLFHATLGARVFWCMHDQLDAKQTQQVGEHRPLVGAARIDHDNERHPMERLFVVPFAPDAIEEKIAQHVARFAAQVIAEMECAAVMVGANVANNGCIDFFGKILRLVFIKLVMLHHAQAARVEVVEHAHRGVDLPHMVGMQAAHGAVRLGLAQRPDIQLVMADRPRQRCRIHRRQLAGLGVDPAQRAQPVGARQFPRIGNRQDVLAVGALRHRLERHDLLRFLAAHRAAPGIRAPFAWTGQPRLGQLPIERGRIAAKPRRLSLRYRPLAAVRRGCQRIGCALERQDALRCQYHGRLH